MSAKLEQRVEKLEGKGSGNGFTRVVLVVMEGEESSRECIIRNGHDPDDKELRFIILQGMKPERPTGETNMVSAVRNSKDY